MDKQSLEIGHPLKVAVYWYDKVPEPPENETFEGEVIGWKDSQMIVRVPGYSVLRFWKKDGREVGNKDFERRGFKVDLKELTESVAKPIEVDMEETEKEVPVEVPSLR